MKSDRKSTIFISFASINDTEIYPSVVNAFLSATYPERIFIGVGLLDRNKKNYKKLKSLKNKNLKVTYTKYNKKLLGVGKGRKRAQDLFEDQDYFLQLDAHSHFNDGWDVEMIKLYKEAKKFSNSDKVIITCIPGRYSYNPERTQSKDESFAGIPCFLDLSIWPGSIPRWTGSDLWNNKEYMDKFYPTAKASSALMFGDTNFGNNTGIEEGSIFYDEEILYSVNLFDMGYSFVFPNINPFPISHLFSDDINEFGGHRDFFTSFLSRREDEEMTQKMQEFYNDFVEDPKNRKKIRKYEKYAKVSVRHGSIKSNYIPKDFNI
jgi:hypothetical protein